MTTDTILSRNGKIVGIQNEMGRVWKGVPYAQPPKGKLRFRHARPVQNWKGIYEAYEYGAVCFQQNRSKKRMDEDCLTLNIWAPAAQKSARAVIFYIHGGSFCSGAGSDPEYDGARLAGNGDVVVVTVNYRLGVLGFLDFSFLGDSFESNCGLSDIVEALRWVYNNIEAFGGDPENITVMGQSAGAITASVLPHMPSAQKYVSKVIMMSGGPTLLYTKEQYQKIARQFLDFMGIEDAEHLYGMPAEELVSRQRRFAAQSGLGEGAFMIEVDGDMVPDYPIPAAAKGVTKNIPMLIGTTKEEMSFLCIKVLSKVMNIKEVLTKNIRKEKEETWERIEAAYKIYGKRAQSMLLTDRVFRMASVWYAEVCSRYAKTWMYRFDYETTAMKMSALRACHSSDIPFLFGNFTAGLYKFMFMLPPYRVCGRISREMQKDFTGFAKNGELAWKRCHGKDTPAKCYDSRFSVAQMVEPEIEAEYDDSAFRRKSFGELDTIG